MKPIIINDRNAERIMKEFSDIQGKATARTVDSFEQLLKIVKEIDVRLYGIPKAALEGTSVIYNFSQQFPNSYKFTPESTHFSLLYSKGSWRITTISRGFCPNRYNNGYPYALKLSDSAKDAVLKLYT